jgi:HlyD family secretion protein
LIALAAAGAVTAWFFLSRPALPAGFASGNGRLEAKQVYISTKWPGRIAEVLFDEGDTVEAGQVLARMDTSSLNAQLQNAEAEIRAAQDARRVARAQINVKQAEYEFAAKQDRRSRALVPSGSVSQREAEMDHASALASQAAVVGSQAAEVEASQKIDAASATADRLRAEIKDAVLVAPVRGRIEKRLSEPGEVLASGGRVFSINNLSDVYMYVYLPESISGKLPLGSEARIVLDAAPQFPIRAFIAYVSPMAQFTPKTVETAEERHNLTFRVKLQIPADKLREYEPLVKSGLPGVGYVRWAADKSWPDKLQSRGGPPPNLWQPTGSSKGAQ